MAYLTDEYWKKERAKEQARKRQEEIKTKVMRVHTNNPYSISYQRLSNSKARMKRNNHRFLNMYCFYYCGDHIVK